MKKPSFLIAAGLFAALLCQSGFVEARKLRPPLHLSLEKTALEASQIRLSFRVRANLQTTRLSLSVELPLGLKLLEGEPKWEGPMGRGESHLMTLLIQGRGGLSDEVLGRAVIALAKGGTFTQKISLSLNPLEEESLHPSPPILLEGGGESVLEFRGRR